MDNPKKNKNKRMSYTLYKHFKSIVLLEIVMWEAT